MSFHTVSWAFTLFPASRWEGRIFLFVSMQTSAVFVWPTFLFLFSANSTLICLWKWKWKSFSPVQLCNPMHYPWNSPGQNTGVGSLSLLWGIFPTQGSNPGLPHCRWILNHLSHKGSPCDVPLGAAFPQLSVYVVGGGVDLAPGLHE